MLAHAVIKGLEGVVAASSALCELDGENGRLAYRGYDIADLVAGGATFEEVVYLLWQGELPTASQLRAFGGELVGERTIQPDVVRAMRLYPSGVAAMAALRAAVAMHGLYDAEAEDDSQEANRRKAVRLTAKLPTLVATYHRIRSGQDELPPRPDLGHGGNFLYMLSGNEPDPAATRALDASLVLYAEHELNASTFTARCVASTGSDVYSAVTAALGALKGPLHGGAGEAVMRTLEEIGTLENVEPYVKKALAERRRLMGLVRAVAHTPRRGEPREGTDPQRGLLYGLPLDGHGYPGGPLRPGHRRRPGRRLDGSSPGTVRGQPPDPSPGGLHGAGTAELRAFGPKVDRGRTRCGAAVREHRNYARGPSEGEWARA
jgi:citrate synthase